MSALAASSCTVVLNQHREQVIQHHGQCNQVAIAPCEVLTRSCTVVENGRVVVKPLQPSVNESSES